MSECRCTGKTRTVISQSPKLISIEDFQNTKTSPFLSTDTDLPNISAAQYCRRYDNRCLWLRTFLPTVNILLEKDNSLSSVINIRADKPLLIEPSFLVLRDREQNDDSQVLNTMLPKHPKITE